ncbi:unnamed protein product [Chondrus crispus]|uniref:Uncharacterized protein n=1 Tax=Chondrus crispus TaxID=2769 RepID=R7QLF6_CHOCR|nr:unnamed protein product [Chondrus crispus]CDF38598.1 unnamed protein product [Chondrus crispus]|eukprot:XP_005718503.1 unnamed protein product [Chondrus crispus]
MQQYRTVRPMPISSNATVGTVDCLSTVKYTNSIPCGDDSDTNTVTVDAAGSTVQISACSTRVHVSSSNGLLISLAASVPRVTEQLLILPHLNTPVLPHCSLCPALVFVPAEATRVLLTTPSRSDFQNLDHPCFRLSSFMH